MATSAQGFVAAAPPSKIVRVANTTLYHVAAYQLGNALLWTLIAQANGLMDPWIGAMTELKIPTAKTPSTTPTGILGL